MSSLNYSLSKPHQFVDKLAAKKRKVMYDYFIQAFPAESILKVADIGVTADRETLAANYFEEFFPHKHKIIAVSDQNAKFLEQQYPGLTFHSADARDLSFE